MEEFRSGFARAPQDVLSALKMKNCMLGILEEIETNAEGLNILQTAWMTFNMRFRTGFVLLNGCQFSGED